MFSLPTSIHACEEGFYHGHKSGVHQFKVSAVSGLTICEVDWKLWE